MPALIDLATATGYDHAHVERALVTEYCRHHQLTPHPNSRVGQLLAEPTPHELAATLRTADTWTLDDLVAAFETLVPAEEAAAYGAVFTPEKITSFMAREACARAAHAGFDLATATVIDPAAGCGALLVAALRELVTRTGQPASLVAGRLTGVDISPDSLRRAGLLLELTCLTLGDPAPPRLRLHAADALTDDITDTGTYTIVVGNPPYVRYQRLPDTQRAALANRWRVCGPGNFNLYFPFFELTDRLLRPGGIAALITPNGYFTSLSGGPVRSWMAARRWLDAVVDFGHHRVFHAMTYTAIAFATRKGDDDGATEFGYVDVAGVEALDALPADWADTRTSRVTWAGLGSRWRLVGPTRRAAVDTIAAAGTPLSQCATVRFGVATCRDRLYQLDGHRDDTGNYLTSYAGETYTIEPGLTRRCVKVSGIASEADLTAATTRIIYPYTLTPTGAQILAEADLAAAYPGGYAYLCAIRDELARRDNGRKTYAAWYAYARTQGLVPVGPRLLTPLYAGRPRFMYDPDTAGLFLNGCAVTAGEGTDLETLSWVLNSGVCRFYVEATANAISNGFFAYQKTQLAGFGVPTLTDEQRTLLRAAADDGERDDLLADLYRINLPAGYRRSSRPED